MIRIGKIAGAHGIRGALKVYSYAESMDLYAAGDRIVLVDSAGAAGTYVVIRAQAYKRIVRLALEGITTRDAAEALIGRDVFARREALPPLEPDTYYWNDLIGMEVFADTGERLGRIEQIIPTGANDVYVVRTAPDHPAAEILIPAIASVVLTVDIEGRRMRVALPEGLV